jgi:hypothetical protein
MEQNQSDHSLEFIWRFCSRYCSWLFWALSFLANPVRTEEHWLCHFLAVTYWLGWNPARSSSVRPQFESLSGSVYVRDWNIRTLPRPMLFVLRSGL